MKKIIGIIITILITLSFLNLFSQDNLSADEILERLDKQMFPESYEGVWQMKTDHQSKPSKSYTYHILSKQGEGTLLEVTKSSDRKEIGRKILIKDDNMWLYIPGTSRPVKLSKKESFMNSDFSNDDLMNDDLSDDYSAKMLDRNADLDGKSHYLLQLDAKNKSVAYNRLKVWVEKEYLTQAKVEYISTTENVLKTLNLSDLKKVAGRIRPVKMQMINELEKGSETNAELIGLRIRDDIKDNVFSLRSLFKAR